MFSFLSSPAFRFTGAASDCVHSFFNRLAYRSLYAGILIHFGNDGMAGAGKMRCI